VSRVLVIERKILSRNAGRIPQICQRFFACMLSPAADNVDPHRRKFAGQIARDAPAPIIMIGFRWRKQDGEISSRSRETC